MWPHQLQLQMLFRMLQIEERLFQSHQLQLHLHFLLQVGLVVWVLMQLGLQLQLHLHFLLQVGLVVWVLM